jgi:hypothetical protein
MLATVTVLDDRNPVSKTSCVCNITETIENEKKIDKTLPVTCRGGP